MASLKHTFRGYGLKFQRMEISAAGFKVRLVDEPKNYDALEWIGKALNWRLDGHGEDEHGFFVMYQRQVEYAGSSAD